MKYLNILVLMTAVTLFAACSDDEVYNSNAVTVGFVSDSYTVRENAKNIDIPILVKGARNGKVSITVITEGTGSNPAKEYTNPNEPGHYIVTDKTLDVLVDDEAERTVNVQISPVDDEVINLDRELKVTIVAVNGGQVSTTSTKLTIVDNESNLYERFAGKWHLRGTVSYENTPNETVEEYFSKEVTITATTDNTKPEYNSILNVLGKELINVGMDLDLNWHFRFTYDREAKNGTLGFICGETIAFYGTYQWEWATLNGDTFNHDDVTATWSLDENDNMPTEITFPEDTELHFRIVNGQSWRSLSNLKLTR